MCRARRCRTGCRRSARTSSSWCGSGSTAARRRPAPSPGTETLLGRVPAAAEPITIEPLAAARARRGHPARHAALAARGAQRARDLLRDLLRHHRSGAEGVPGSERDDVPLLRPGAAAGSAEPPPHPQPLLRAPPTCTIPRSAAGPATAASGPGSVRADGPDLVRRRRLLHERRSSSRSPASASGRATAVRSRPRSAARRRRRRASTTSTACSPRSR